MALDRKVVGVGDEGGEVVGWGGVREGRDGWVLNGGRGRDVVAWGRG